jgi:hypothetical protein
MTKTQEGSESMAIPEMKDLHPEHLGWGLTGVIELEHGEK